MENPLFTLIPLVTMNGLIIYIIAALFDRRYQETIRKEYASG